MPTTLILVILFILGLAAGSFLNVVTLRYRPEENFFDPARLRGRSRCPRCGKTLRWFELIPLVSFLVQKGKCSACCGRLSLQYPLVELASGLLFLFVPLALTRFYGFRGLSSLMAPWWEYFLLALWLLVFLVWLAIVIIDLRHYLIPNELSLTLGILGVVLLATLLASHDFLPMFRDSFLRHYALLFSPPGGLVVNRLLGALAGGIFFTLLALLGKGKAMGWGDVKLALGLGFILGWPDIALTSMLAFLIGGVWGLVLILTGEKRMGDRLPFAPFLILGAVLNVFFGFALLHGYFSLFNL